MEVFDWTIDLIHELIRAGIKLGVASSSKNCEQVLKAVNLLPLFSARIDGVVSAELGLHGKPEPDIFTTACKILGANPKKSVVVDDAVSGVQAGKKGNFELTLGIARENNAKELLENEADFVEADLRSVSGIEGLNEIFVRFSKNNRF